MKKQLIMMSIVGALVLGILVLNASAQTEVAPVAAGNTGREYPKSGVFNEGGAGDIARASTYRISLTDGNWQAFDSALLEGRLADALSENGFAAQRVAAANDADLILSVRIDPIAGEQGAGINVSVMVNIDRLTPTKYPLAYGFSGVAPTPEDVLAKFAKALTKGVRGVKAGEPK
jgi:hypothetical protein